MKVLNFLAEECGLSQGSAIAGIGSGTGIFTALLLKRGCKVYAVEANKPMQAAAVHRFDGNENFIPVNANAETTTLPDQSIELIVCAQAFHWFNNNKTHAEFKRMLKDGEYTALIWNNRQADADAFSMAYENLLKTDTPEYNEVNHRNISEKDLESFFRNGEFKTADYRNNQVFDEGGLMGRAMFIPDEQKLKDFKTLIEPYFKKIKSNQTQIQSHTKMRDTLLPKLMSGAVRVKI